MSANKSLNRVEMNNILIQAIVSQIKQDDDLLQKLKREMLDQSVNEPRYSPEMWISVRAPVLVWPHSTFWGVRIRL